MKYNGVLAEVFFGSITGFNMGAIGVCLLLQAIVYSTPAIVCMTVAQVVATIWFIKTH